MSGIAQIRAECRRRLEIGNDGIYITSKRKSLPTGEQVRLAVTAGPRSIGICVVKDSIEGGGGYEITAIYRASEVLKFLERIAPEAR